MIGLQAEKRSAVLFVPKLPPSLSNWNLLKNHFSDYGNVVKIILNPQQRNCTVCFKTEEDAQNALRKGNVWKGKEFEILRWQDATKSLLDPRALNASSSYSDLDNMEWDVDLAEDIGKKESFGVSEEGAEESSKKRRLFKTRSVSREAKHKYKETRKLELEKGESKIKSPVKSSRTRLIKSRTLSKDILRRTPRTAGVSKSATLVSEKKLMRKLIKEDLPRDVCDNIDIKKELDLKEKLSLLEERDKSIRKSLAQAAAESKLGKVIVGTCPDMCPEKERIMREYRRLVSPYEFAPNSHRMDPVLAVKEYSRSSADQEEPLPHDLRPEPVLSMTMAYLITKIMPLIEDPDVNVRDWYDFCWDRLRSIRKDIIQQQLCDLEIVTIIEQCARFHICCYDRLWGADPEVFDMKINTENLMNCLQALRHMYEDLGKDGTQCPNEGEFNAYLILLNMKTGDLMAEYQQFSPRLQSDETIRSAVDIYLAYNNSMYCKFFSLVEKSSYLNACLLQRYFLLMRVRALQAIVKAYCPPKKAGTIPMKNMMRILRFDNRDDASVFCESHGLLLKDVKDEFKFYRQNFSLPEVEVKINSSSSLVTGKRVPVLNAVVGENNPAPIYVRHEVSSSFTADSKLIHTDKDYTLSKVGVNLKVKTVAASDSEQDMDDECVEEGEGEEEVIDLGDNEEISTRNEKESSPFTYGEKMEEDAADENQDPFSTKKQADPLRSSGIGNFKFVLDKENVGKQTNEDTRNGANATFRFMNPIEIAKQNEPQPIGVPSADVISLQTNQLAPQQQQRQSFSFVLPPKNIPEIVVNQFGRNVTDEIQASKKKPTKEYKFQTVEEIFNSGERQQFIDPNTLSANSDRPVTDNVIYHLKSKVPVIAGINKSQLLLLKGENRYPVKPIGSSGFSWNSGLEQEKDDLPLSPKECKSPKKYELADDSAFFSKSTERESSSSEFFSKGNEMKIYEDISSDGMNKSENSYDETDSSGVYFSVAKSSCTEKGKEKPMKGVHDEEERSEENKKRKKKMIDDETMKKLRKDLRKRWKAVAARKCGRLWKRKVEKIKQSRRDFPLMLYVPSEQHIPMWGALSGNKSTPVVLRAKEKDRNLKIVTTILQRGLPNNVPFVGQQIAESVILKHKLIEKKEVNALLNWKLVISVPVDDDKKFIAEKFADWSKRLFYNSKDDAVLGSATKCMSSLNVPVYYSAHVVAGNSSALPGEHNNKLSGVNALIFVTVAGMETAAEKRVKRCKKLLTFKSDIKPVRVVLINIGDEEENRKNRKKFVNFLDGEKAKGAIGDWTEERWIDISSVVNALKFLTLNVDPNVNETEISVGTLTSVVRKLSESLFDYVSAVNNEFPEFSACIKNPENLISVYNKSVARLERKLMENICRYKNFVPPEFMEFVNVKDELSLNFSTYMFDKTHKKNFSKTVKSVSLPCWTGRWPPKSHSQFFYDLKTYCQSIECKELLPRIMRLIALDEDEKIEDCVQNVPWVIIIEMWARHVVAKSSSNQKSVVVIYNENNISDIVNGDWWLNLLSCT